MKNFIFYILGIVVSICTAFFCLYYAFSIPSFSPFFYIHQYEKNNTYEIIGMEETELMSATSAIIDYLKDDGDDLYVKVKIDGKSVEFYNDREKTHMVDVKNQYESGKHLRNISFITAWIIIFIFYILKADTWKIIARTNQIVFSLVILVTLSLSLFALIDFNKIFVLFHEILYNNDLWLLDPKESRLINMVPQSFFTDIVTIIVSIFLGSSIGILILSTLYLKKRKVM